MELEKRTRLLRVSRQADNLNLSEGVKVKVNESIFNGIRPKKGKKDPIENETSKKEVKQVEKSSNINVILSLCETKNYKQALVLLGKLQSSSSDDFMKTVTLLLRSNHYKDLVHSSSMEKLAIKNTSESWRLKKLSEVLMRFRSKEPSLDLVGVSLFLANPSLWFSATKTNFRELSQIIISFRELEEIIPTYFNFFEQNRFIIHKKSWEDAIWEPTVDAKDLFPWESVGKLHLFLSSENVDFALLLDAWCFFNSIDQALWKRYYEWVEHSLTVVNCIESKVNIQKKNFLKLLNVDNFDPINVDKYLSEFSLINHDKLFEFLRRKCEERGATKTELKILLMRAELNKMNKNELTRIVECSSTLKCYKLVESARSILVLRRSKVQREDVCFRISKLAKMDKNLFLRALIGFSKKESKFLNSFLRLGPWIHSAIHQAQPGFCSLKMKDLRKPYHRKDFLSVLSHPVLSFPNKIYVNARDIIDGHETPVLFNEIIWNDWSHLFSRFYQIFGLNYFDRIANYLNNVNPSLSDVFWEGRTDCLKKHILKHSNDLKGCWFQLLKMNSQIVSVEVKNEIINTFLIRFTTLLVQDDFLSLSAAQLCKFDDKYVSGLESWMFSNYKSEIN